MTPWQLLILLIMAAICGTAGRKIGRYKGYTSDGTWLGILLGAIGLAIIALIPRTREAKVAEAQRQYEIQAEAARNAGYPYPYSPQQPYQQQPYPPHGQWPQTWQAPPGQQQ